MIVIGIDIATDCKIPKGTICYGHKNKDGITVIDKIGRYSLIEEKKTLSDKIDVVISRGYGIPNAPAILVKDVKQSIKEIKEDLKTGKNKWLTKGSVDLDEECVAAIIEIIDDRVGKRLI